MRWIILVIAATGRLRHEDCEFKASLGFIEQDPVSKTKQKGRAGFRLPAARGDGDEVGGGGEQT